MKAYSVIKNFTLSDPDLQVVQVGDVVYKYDDSVQYSIARSPFGVADEFAELSTNIIHTGNTDALYSWLGSAGSGVFLTLPASGSFSDPSHGGGPAIEHVLATGAESIGNGNSTVSISGLALSSSPSGASLTVKKGDVADDDFGVLNYYDLTTDGFTATLTGNVTNANYELSYIVY